MGIIKLKQEVKMNNQNKEQVDKKYLDENVSNDENYILKAKKERLSNSAIIKEYTSKADKVSRHFKLNNGTAKSFISATPINFFDETENKWKRVDNSLLETNQSYEGYCGKFRTEILKPECGKVIKMSYRDLEISWEYLGKINSSQQNSVLTQNKSNPTSLNIGAYIENSLQSVSSKAIYENADQDTDIEYDFSGNNVKESIIIKEKANEYKYLFSLKIQGLKLRVSEDNESLEFYSETTNENGKLIEKIEAIIPAPFMFDANGISNNDVYFELEPGMEGKYTFTVVANSDWINEPGRAFPVVIDPIIITSGEGAITKQVQYRNFYSSGSGSGSSITSSDWYNISSNYIKVSKTGSTEYKTLLTIKKSLMSLLEYDISSVKLFLVPYRILSAGSVFINNKLIYVNSLSKKEVDITSIFKNANSDFNISILASDLDNVNAEFYATGANAPIVEVEYIINGQAGVVKEQFLLSNEISGYLNVATGDLCATFTDVPKDDFVLGVGISHIYKKSDSLYNLGKNIRLNLNENLLKTGSSELDTDYSYTDMYGDKYGFKEKYYYLNELGIKVEIPKSSIKVDLDGNFLHIDDNCKTCKIQKELFTETGLKIITRIEGIKYCEYLNQKSDEYKQLENQKQSYENMLKSMVLVNINDGNIAFRLKNYLKKDEFSTFYNNISGGAESIYLLCSESEAINYRSLLLQKQSLEIQYNSLQNQLESININQEYNIYLRNTEGEKEEVTEDVYNYYKDTVVNLGKQYNNTQSQQELIGMNNQNLNTQSENTQIENISCQLKLMRDNGALYKIQIEQYFKEYLNVQHQIEQYDRQTPVNYLTDGKIVKGFNALGWLVAVFDNYKNAITIEYDESGKIQNVYDNENNQIIFDYDSFTGLLSSITDMRGRKTNYKYSTDGELINVSFANGKSVDITYDDYGNISSVESSDKLKSDLEYANFYELSKVTYTSLVGKIEHGKTLSSGTYNISEMLVSFTPTVTIITDNKKNKKYYKCDDEDKIYEYYEEKDGKVVKAEKYDYVPYEKDNVQSAKRSSLYAKAFSAFTSEDFTGGDTVNTVLDDFNNPATQTTNAQELSDGTTKQTSVTYKYDDNHKCIKEEAEVTIKKGTSVLKTYKQITAYNYNAAGDVVRKESYIADKLYTIGKTVEETVYDENGNAVKSFTYNSLDSSSKFYMESEVGENGQVLADYDETGENKTEYEYISGTNVIRSQKLANGSKLAYGHDVDDTVTSITQSTEYGEENSTQTRYTCGQVTELVSGNNTVNYEYDYKRRKTAVKLNGTTHVSVGYSADDAEEETVTVTDANGGVFTCIKDSRGNIKKTAFNSATQVENTYNTKGQFVSLSDKVSNETVNVTYDTLDRQETYSCGNYTETNSYDDFGKVGSVTQSGDGGRTYTYAYKDNAARDLESITTGVYKFSPQTDKLGRNAGREISNNSVKVAGEYIYYRKVGDHATNMPSSVRYGRKQGDEFVIMEGAKYTYDKVGNIEKIFENGELTVRYAYDALSRLVREDNKKLQKTYLYEYDNNGNILCRRETGFTLSANVEEKSFTTYNYTYIGDRVMSYNGTGFEYDDLGNPETYRGYKAKWEKGRQLVSYKDTLFSYDGRGRRREKGEIKFNYDANDRLIKQSDGLEFIYDASGVAGVVYQGNTYFYQKDIFNNIAKILDANGNIIVQYVYNAWGKYKVLNANGQEIDKSDDGHIGNKNTFRYRSYYFDTETELYYLKSRYYDPELGRFITIDDISYLDPETINGLNLYAYCGNNPVMFTDPAGNTKWWEWLFAGLIVVACVVGAVFTAGLLGAAFVGAAIGGGISLVTQAIGGELNWGQFALDIGVGALTGMLGMSGISRVGATVLGGLIGGVSNIGSQLIGGVSWDEINWCNWWKVSISAVIGGLSSFIGGAGARNAQKLNSSSRVSKAIESVNKVFARQNSGYYSAARYANAALTNVANRLGKAVAKQQLIMFTEAMIAFAVGTAANYGLTFWW